MTLTPGYFWYLSLHPQGPGQVRIGFGGGMSPDFVADPEAQAHFAATEDAAGRGQRRGSRLHREGLPRPLVGPRRGPGHLSHLERPNYDFARYLAAQMDGA